MKILTILATMLLLTSCKKNYLSKDSDNYFQTEKSDIQTVQTQNNTIQKRTETDTIELEKSRKESIKDLKNPKLYKLTDTIVADLNDDGYADKAFLKKEKNTSGIIIIHGHTNEQFRIGFGKDFGILEKFECEWVDYWVLIEDKKTYETVFSKEGDVEGSRNINLENLSIYLAEDELSGGLITYLNGKYIWVHQTC